MMTYEERQEFICAVREAAAPAPQLTEEEVQYVKLAIKREAQSIELRQAIIEKSLTALVASAFGGFFYLIVDFAKNHGFK